MGSLQVLIDSIANNKLYLVIASGFLGVLLFPLLKFLAQKFWALITKAFTRLNRNRKFRADYLSWLINANKYISILPTTLTGVKSSTLHRQELDKRSILLWIFHREKTPAGRFPWKKFLASIEELLSWATPALARAP
jgi:hypothetical protein